MPAKITSTVRYLFVSTLVTACLVAGLESVASGHEQIGLKSCGWKGNPCELAPLVVKAQRAPQIDAQGELIAQR